MAGRKRNASRPPSPVVINPRSTRASARIRAAASASTPVPKVYRELLAEAKRTGATATNSQGTGGEEGSSAERPLKRRRPGGRTAPSTKQQVAPEETKADVAQPSNANDGEDDEDEDDIEFEDVVLPPPTVQTIVRDSDDEEDEDDDDELVDVHISSASAAGTFLGSTGSSSADQMPKELNLNLTAQQATMAPARRLAQSRRKAIGKDEKERRVEVHKIHLLCLLAHVELRNRWCGGRQIQAVLKPLLTDKMLRFLRPKSTLSQFGRSEALKNGVQETAAMFRMKFAITERGMRRALWADDEETLKNVGYLSLLCLQAVVGS